MSFTVKQASILYRIPVIDYLADPTWQYGREADWLLVSAGTGLMLSVMDVEPRFRYCVDSDGIPDAMSYRIGEWLLIMQRLVERVCAVGWYSNPENARPLLKALAPLHTAKVYLGNVPAAMLEEYGFDPILDLSDFLSRLRQPSAPVIEDSFV